MPELIALDATSVDASNTQYDLEDEANGIQVLLDTVDWDDPEDDQQTVGTADTEGDIFVSARPTNRAPSLSVKITKSTAAALDTAIGNLQKKISKIAREGGTLKRTTVGGNVGILDLTGAHMAPKDDWIYQHRNVVVIPLKFRALPYWRKGTTTTTRAWTPADITGLELWFDATQITGKTDGQAISQWDDESGNDDHLVQGTGDNQPLYKTGIQNSLPAVLFDGSNDRLDIATIAADTSRTVFIVAKQSANTGNATVLSLGTNACIMNATGPWGWSTNAASANVSLGGATTTCGCVTAKVNSNASLDGYLNDGTATNLDPNDQVGTSTTLRIGGRTDGTRPWNGYVMEIVVYNTALSDSDREMVADYLGEKWGLGYGAEPAEVEVVTSAEATAATFSETALPVVVVDIASVGGDVPALGRLALSEDDAEDQRHLHGGVQSRYAGTASTEELFYEAEGCLIQGGAALAALSGASGGTVVTQGTLTTSYQSMLSLATSGTVYPQHVGDFNLWTRLYRPTSNAGTVSVALEWSEGDFTRFTRNDPVVFDADDREGDFTIANLGQVNLAEVKKGSQRWDGHIIAKSSTLGDDLSVDCWWLQPVGEGAFDVTATAQFQTVTSFSARDEFDQSAGALTGKTPAVGAAWASGGDDADDFSVETTGKTAQRTATGDTDYVDGGRRDVCGSNMTDCIVQADMKASAVPGTNPLYMAVVARWVDANNYMLAGIQVGTDGAAHLRVRKIIGGSSTSLATESLGTLVLSSPYTVRLQVTAGGHWFAWAWRSADLLPTLLASGQDSTLKTGGTLASGKPGIHDGYQGNSANTRNYDNFWAAVPASDAVLFASRDGELRHDSYIRQDSGGNVWAEKAVEGDYLLIPSSGLEGRAPRLMFKMSRGNPDTMFDSGIDDVSGTVYVTPRYRSFPA